MLCDELMNKTWIFYVICVRLIFYDLNYVAYLCKSNSRFYLGEKLRSGSIFYGKMKKNHILQQWRASHAWQSNGHCIKVENAKSSVMTSLTHKRSNLQCHTMSIIPPYRQEWQVSFPKGDNCHDRDGKIVNPFIGRLWCFDQFFVKAPIPRFN